MSQDKAGTSRLATIVAALAIAACVPATAPAKIVPLTPAELETYPDARGMPPDVQRFIVQWHDCAHWLGEPPYDPARARQIEVAVADTCPGVDATGAAMRARHAGNPEVLARIADYGPLGQ